MKFIVNKEFKGTPIGRIPKDWELLKLGDVIVYIKGKKPEKTFKEYQDGYLPYLTTEYLRENKPIKYVKPSNDDIIVNDEDLLLLWDGSNSGEFFYGKKGILSSTMVKIVQKKLFFNQKFLFYLLKLKEKELKGTTKGTGIPHVEKSILNNMFVQKPPLSEQEKIAEILSTVDLAIEKVEEEISKMEQLKKGLMQELLTKGIGHKEFKDTPIGRIPKDWEVVKVKSLFKVVTGTTPSTKVKDYWNNGNIEWLTPKDLSRVKNSIFLPPSERKITKLALRDTNLTLLPKYSILISTRAPIGYVGINDKEVSFNQGCKGLIPLNRQICWPFFYAYYLRSKTSFLNSISGGSTFKELSKDRLEEIIVPLPPFSEQQRIAEILSTVDELLDVKKREKEKLQKLKKGLMVLLLTGEIRVIA